MPETKGLSLEELSEVFKIPTAMHARFGLDQARAFFNWCLSRNPGLQMPVLLDKSPNSTNARRGFTEEIEEIKHGFTEPDRPEAVQPVLV